MTLKTEKTAIQAPHGRSAGLRVLKITGVLLLLAYVAYYFLFQAHPVWQSPTLLPDKWPTLFKPVTNLFPESWVRAPRYSAAALVDSILYLVLLAALFAIYVVGLKRLFKPGAFEAKHSRRALTWIVLLTLGALAVLAIVPGVLSTDLFSYVWYGRIFAVFGDNPLTHVPADYYWQDRGRWLQWVYWKETPSVYGPVWLLFAGGIATIAQALGGDIVLHVLGHKLLASLAHLANVILIWQVAGIVIARYWQQPASLGSRVTLSDWRLGARVAVTVAYAWNPLVMLEFGANGHNDVLMLTGILAALWLHLTGRWRMAVVALSVAAMMKFIVVLLLPGYLWLLFWQTAPGGFRHRPGSRVWKGVQAIILFAAPIVIFYLPFWDGLQTVKPLFAGPPVEMFVNSLGTLLRFKVPDAANHLAAIFGWQPADFWTVQAVGDRINMPSRLGPTLIFATVAVTQTWRARTFPAMVIAWGWMLFAYLTIGAVWFWPWYVTWLVPIVVLVGPGRLFTASLILSFTSMTLYGTYWRGSKEFMELSTWSPLVMMVPPLAYLFVAWLRGKRTAQGEVPARRAPSPASRPASTPVPLIPAEVRATTQEPQQYAPDGSYLYQGGRAPDADQYE